LIISDLYLAKFLDTSVKNRSFHVGFELVWTILLARFDERLIFSLFISIGYSSSIHTSVPTPVYGAPYALPDVAHISLSPSIDLGLPFALKLNAFTIAKILLKLVIFKMIVKFIAVICLLLFIPKLEIIKKKVSNKDDDDEERNFSSRKFSN